MVINYNNVTKKSENIYKPSMQEQTSDRRGGNKKAAGCKRRPQAGTRLPQLVNKKRPSHTTATENAKYKI